MGKRRKKKKTTAKKLENKLSPTPNTNAKLFSLIILLAVKHFNAIMLVIIRRHDTTQSLLIRYLRYKTLNDGLCVYISESGNAN
jgi:hypothetical protein